jgi:hypothetical protein
LNQNCPRELIARTKISEPFNTTSEPLGTIATPREQNADVNPASDAQMYLEKSKQYAAMARDLDPSVFGQYKNSPSSARKRFKPVVAEVPIRPIEIGPPQEDNITPDDMIELCQYLGEDNFFEFPALL